MSKARRISLIALALVMLLGFATTALATHITNHKIWGGPSQPQTSDSSTDDSMVINFEMIDLNEQDNMMFRAKDLSGTNASNSFTVTSTTAINQDYTISYKSGYRGGGYILVLYGSIPPSDTTEWARYSAYWTS